MNRDEWNQVLDTELVTPNQRGAIMREFGRLGILDRGERLAICAALLGLGELRSTAELVMGQAGQLVNVLRQTGDRAELPDVTPPPIDSDTGEHQGDDDDQDDIERVTLAEAICQVIVMIYVAYWKGAPAVPAEHAATDAYPLGESGDIALPYEARESTHGSGAGLGDRRAK